MTKYDEQPAYWLMRWIENRLRDEELIPEVEAYSLDSSDTDGANFAVPFFGVAMQTPEATTVHNESGFSNVPFSVYTVTHNFDNEMPYMRNGEFAFVVYFDDTARLFEIANYIIDISGRSHWSAADINSYFADDAEYPFEFKTIYIDSAAGPMETEDEGGRFAFMITIAYTSTYEGINRPAENAPAFMHRDVGRV